MRLRDEFGSMFSSLPSPQAFDHTRKGRVDMGLLSKEYDFTIGADGINTIEKITVGGVEQALLIQGHHPSHPVLLFLHGGPSMPLPGVSSRGRDYTVATNTKELVKEYVVVFWDQRGTGKSYTGTIAPESMRLSQFVSDATEIVDYLRERFGQERLYLAAHSFGSLIGMHLIQQQPDKFHSYVGLSQIVSWTENDKLSYTWALAEAKRRNNRKALKELDAVGAPPYVDSMKQWGVLRKWQTRFGTLIFSDDTIKHPGLMAITGDMLRSKDYTLKDCFNTFYKGFKLVYNQAFIQSLPCIDLKKTMKEVEIPVTFIHGTRDVHVHGELLVGYYEGLVAKRGKRMIWMDRSAHVFHPEDTSLIEQVLIREKYREGGQEY